MSQILTFDLTLINSVADKMFSTENVTVNQKGSGMDQNCIITLVLMYLHTCFIITFLKHCLTIRIFLVIGYIIYKDVLLLFMQLIVVSLFACFFHLMPFMTLQYSI